MRFSSILPLLGAASLAQAFTRKSDQPTEYNGVEVPPLLNFNPETHDAALNSSSLVLIKYHRYSFPKTSLHLCLAVIGY